MKATKSISALLGLLSVGALQAGEPTVIVIEEPPSAFSGSLSMGYDTDYIFRGADLGKNAVWTGVDLNFQLSEMFSLNVGAWYINPTSGPIDDELDLYAFLNTSFGDLDVGIGFTEYLFPEGGGDAAEPSLMLGYSLGMVDVGFLYAYDFQTSGSYFELSAGTAIELSDDISLEIGTGVSYAESYYGVSGFNNVYLSASLPIAITNTLTLAPYISQSWAIDGLESAGGGDHLYGGASLSVSF